MTAVKRILLVFYFQWQYLILTQFRLNLIKYNYHHLLKYATKIDLLLLLWAEHPYQELSHLKIVYIYYILGDPPLFLFTSFNVFLHSFIFRLFFRVVDSGPLQILLPRFYSNSSYITALGSALHILVYY